MTSFKPTIWLTSLVIKSLGRKLLQNNPGIPARHPIVMLRKSFRDLFTGLVILIFGAHNVPFVYSLSQNKSCKEHPRLIGPCFNVHGRLSYYNGAPSLRTVARRHTSLARHIGGTFRLAWLR